MLLNCIICCTIVGDDRYPGADREPPPKFVNSYLANGAYGQEAWNMFPLLSSPCLSFPILSFIAHPFPNMRLASPQAQTLDKYCGHPVGRPSSGLLYF